MLSDDDFTTLVEALVEGRGFWRNMRRALGLLLGGNVGEVGLMIASALSGLPTPLTTRQVLTVNLVTDVFPAVSVAIQPPEHRNLALLSREGGSALDAPLRADVIRRGVATALPSFGAYVLATDWSDPPPLQASPTSPSLCHSWLRRSTWGRPKAGCTPRCSEPSVAPLRCSPRQLYCRPCELS